MFSHLHDNCTAPLSDRLFFNHLLRHGPTSRAKIAAQYRLSRPTASDAASRLTKRQLIQAMGKDEPRRGKRGRLPEPYRINPEIGSILTFVVGFTFVEARVFSLEGKLEFTTKIETNWESIEETTATMRRALEELETKVDKALAATISVIMPVNPVEQKIVIPDSPYFPDGPFDFSKELSTRLNCPVYLDNHAVWSLLAETHLGVACDSSSTLTLHMGAEFICGFSFGKTIYRGKNGRAGVIEALTANGKSLHAVVSSVAISNDETRLTRRMQRFNYQKTAENFLSNSQDSKLAKVLDTFSEHLANALVLLDPELLVLTGPMASNSDFIRLVTHSLEEKIPENSAKIRVSKNGSKAVELGLLLGAQELTLAHLGLPPVNPSGPSLF